MTSAFHNVLQRVRIGLDAMAGQVVTWTSSDRQTSYQLTPAVGPARLVRNRSLDGEVTERVRELRIHRDEQASWPPGLLDPELEGYFTIDGRRWDVREVLAADAASVHLELVEFRPRTGGGRSAYVRNREP